MTRAKSTKTNDLNVKEEAQKMNKSSIYDAVELQWLKAGSVNATPEGADVVDKEYKRTLCSIRLLHAVLDGDYDYFSSCQSEEARITQESFNSMREYVKGILKTEDDIHAMYAYLVINDLGKVGDFVEKVKKSCGFTSVDHDKILYAGLDAQPELSPLFASLDYKYQELILDGLKSSFNMGQFVQSECPAASLEPISDMYEKSFNFYMVHVLFDIAGAAGHVNPNGSLICNEIYWRKFSFALKALTELVEGYYDADRAYIYYLESVAEYYGFPRDNYAFIRLTNMLRITNIDDIIKLRDAIAGLPDSVRDIIIRELRVTGSLVSGQAILLYYLPATFSNAYNYYLKKDKDNAIFLTINKIAPIIAGIYKRVREESSSFEDVIVVNIAEVAKAAMDPEKMLQNFKLNRVGDDFEVVKSNLIISYSDKPVLHGKKSIFLAGPTPRPDNKSRDIPSWRKEALRILEEKDFDGIVYVPEYEIPGSRFNFDTQFNWECEALEGATAILFWLPRDIQNELYGMTTNNEMGHYGTQDNAFYGRPIYADSIRYQDAWYLKYHPDGIIYADLKSLVECVVEYCKTL